MVQLMHYGRAAQASLKRGLTPCSQCSQWIPRRSALHQMHYLQQRHHHCNASVPGVPWKHSATCRAVGPIARAASTNAHGIDRSSGCSELKECSSLVISIQRHVEHPQPRYRIVGELEDPMISGDDTLVVLE